MTHQAKPADCLDNTTVTKSCHTAAIIGTAVVGFSTWKTLSCDYRSNALKAKTEASSSDVTGMSRCSGCVHHVIAPSVYSLYQYKYAHCMSDMSTDYQHTFTHPQVLAHSLTTCAHPYLPSPSKRAPNFPHKQVKCQVKVDATEW